MRSTPAARKRVTTHFPPKCDENIFIWSQAWLPRQNYLLIYFSASLPLWETREWMSRGAWSNAPALWAKHGQFATCCKEVLKGEKNYLCCKVIPRSSAKFDTEKNHLDSQVTLLSLYGEVLDTTMFSMCKLWLVNKIKHTLQLQNWLCASVCKMKINLLTTLLWCLVCPPGLLVLLISYEWQKMNISWWFS